MPKCPNGKKNCDCTPEELRQAALRNKNQPKAKAPPKVFKVKDPDPDDRYADIHPHLPQPPALLLIVGSVKQGKCLFEYSLVETTEGKKYIKNVKVGDKVLSDNGFVEVEEVFKQDKKECYKIILDNDFELILTEDHKLHTINGMKPMKDCDNEMIITKNGMKKIKYKEYYGCVECYDISVKNENHRFYCNDISVSNSNLLVNLLCNPDMYKDKFDIVKIISNTLNADPKGKLLNKYFDCEDHYNDEMITDIIESQKKYEDFERPTVAMVLDDILTKDFKKTNAVSFLATRFRHYGIGLLAFTTQSFRAVSGLIRNNATDVIIMKQQNQKELDKVQEEYGDLFPNIFMDLYNKAIGDAPYSFLYLDMQTNPATAYIRFETKIAEGENKLF